MRVGDLDVSFLRVLFTNRQIVYDTMNVHVDQYVKHSISYSSMST